MISFLLFQTFSVGEKMKAEDTTDSKGAFLKYEKLKHNINVKTGYFITK